MRVTTGDSGLCCCACVTTFERWLIPLCIAFLFTRVSHWRSYLDGKATRVVVAYILQIVAIPSVRDVSTVAVVTAPVRVLQVVTDLCCGIRRSKHTKDKKNKAKNKSKKVILIRQYKTCTTFRWKYLLFFKQEKEKKKRDKKTENTLTNDTTSEIWSTSSF